MQNLLSSSLLPKNLKITIYRNIILPVVFYECETWSLTLKEERRPRLFENRALRRIFGPKRAEVTGEWSNYVIKSLMISTPQTNIIRVMKSRRMKWARHVERMGGSRETEGKRLLGRPRRRWEDNIKMYLQEVECEFMDWIDMDQVRDRRRALVNAVMNLRIP